MGNVRQLLTVQAFSCKRSVIPFFLSLCLWMPWPSMECKDSQFHQPDLKAAVTKALGCSPRISIVAKKGKWQEYIDGEIRKLQSEGLANEVNAKLAEAKISEVLYMIGESGLNERKFGLDKIMGYVNAGIKGASTLAQILPVGKVLKLISLGLSKIGRKK